MDWIHCNSCTLQPGDQKERRFALSSCGHIYCDLCVERSTKDRCQVCNNVCNTVLLTGQMRPDIQHYFTDPEEILKKAMQIMEFQKGHRQRLSTSRRAQVFNELAATEEINKLRNRIQELEGQVVELKGIIERFEKRFTPAPSSSSMPTGKTGSWPQLSQGSVLSNGLPESYSPAARSQGPDTAPSGHYQSQHPRPVTPQAGHGYEAAYLAYQHTPPARSHPLAQQKFMQASEHGGSPGTPQHLRAQNTPLSSPARSQVCQTPQHQARNSMQATSPRNSMQATSPQVSQVMSPNGSWITPSRITLRSPQSSQSQSPGTAAAAKTASPNPRVIAAQVTSPLGKKAPSRISSPFYPGSQPSPANVASPLASSSSSSQNSRPASQNPYFLGTQQYPRK